MATTTMRLGLILILSLAIIQISKAKSETEDQNELDQESEASMMVSSSEEAKIRNVREAGKNGNKLDRKEENAQKKKKKKKGGKARRKAGRRKIKVGRRQRKKGGKAGKGGKKPRNGAGRKRPRKGKKRNNNKRKSEKEFKKKKKKRRQNKNGKRQKRITKKKGKSKKVQTGIVRQGTCDEAKLCQKIKDYIKYSNQLRKVRRIVKSCDTMDKKATKAATEFSATVAALDQVISGNAKRQLYIRWRRTKRSTDEVVAIRDNLKNCSASAKAKCEKSVEPACAESAIHTECDAALEAWLKSFGPSKGSCLQASADCCACITALPEVDAKCLDFEAKSKAAVDSKKKCTGGTETGSFGFCRKQQQDASVKGPKAACGGSTATQAPGASTTKAATGASTAAQGLIALPSNVKVNASSTDHCCKQRSFGGGSYILVGKHSHGHEEFGCVNDCIFSKAETTNVFCFKSGESNCTVSSDHFTSFNESAIETGKIIEELFENKTNEYGNLKTFTSLKDKLDWIKKDLENYTGKNFTELQQEIDFNRIIQNFSPIRRQKFKAFKTTVEAHLEKIRNVFQEHDHHDDLNDELDAMKEDLLHQTHDDHELHEISHQVIESTRVISNIVKPETHGGSDRLNNLFKAIVAHTEQSNMTFDSVRQLGPLAQCDCGCNLVNSVFGLAGGCIPGGYSPLCIGNSIIGGGIMCTNTAFEGIGYSACFAPSSKVETVSGIKDISKLVIGDLVRTYSGGIGSHFTEFIGWLDREELTPVKMIRVSTSQEISSLTLSGSHIVFTSNTTKYADELLPGDCLKHWNGTHIVEQTITQIENTFEFGWRAPLTREGTLLVDGYLASCYASFPHKLADVAMIPVKAIPTIFLDNEESQHEDGVRTVVKKIKKIGEVIGARKIKSNTNDDPFSSKDKDIQLQAFTKKMEL